MPVSTLARVVLVLGGLLGLLGDALLNVRPWGLALPIWVSLTAIGLGWMVRASRMQVKLRFWLALGTWVLLSFAFAWRDADALKLFNASPCWW